MTTFLSSGKYRLLNLKTRTYMTVGSNGTSVYGKNFEAKNQSQQWYIYKDEAGVTIKSASKSNGQDKYLSASGSGGKSDVGREVNVTSEGPFAWYVVAATGMLESMIIKTPSDGLCVEQIEIGAKTYLNKEASGTGIRSQIWIPVEATD